MRSGDESLVEARIAALRGRLREWLLYHAYARWAKDGIDGGGGFVEAIAQDGLPLPLPRRARVQPRQLYSFAMANRLGWRGDVSGIVRAGLKHMLSVYRRSDGLFRTLVDARGTTMDDRALLYDQAFVLLGLAAAQTVGGSGDEIEALAIELRNQIELRWRTADGGFLSGESEPDPRLANPHMHLLEACIEWSVVGRDATWAAWADDLAALASSRFVHPGNGAILEAWTAEWGPAPGTAGRIVEPGHQFEWAWLLLRARGRRVFERRAFALHLISIAEQHGVFAGLAVNSLLDDLTVHDGDARLWPQAERLKANISAYRLTGETPYLEASAEAASAMLRYLDTPLPGLWQDLRYRNGTFASTPAYASTLYHLVGAILELDAGSQSSRLAMGAP